MRRKPFQQIPLTGVLKELAALSPEAFDVLREATHSHGAFDLDKDRLAIVSSDMGLDEDSVRIIFNALLFMYSEIYKIGLGNAHLKDVVLELIDTIEKNESTSIEDRINRFDIDKISERLTVLLEKDDKIDRFRKNERLRSGFVSNATSFGSFVDLRPRLSENQLQIEDLIPIIQFRIRTDSDNPDLKSFVFQLDATSLRRLREAVENAESKLKSIMKSAEVLHLSPERDK